MEKGQGKGMDTLQVDNVFTRKEYIERENLLRHLNDVWLTVTPTDAMPDDDRQLAKMRCDGIEIAMEAVEDFPAADVTPAVRCKECKHSAIDDIGLLYCKCVTYYNHVPEDWFCADGERKDGDGE